MDTYTRDLKVKIKEQSDRINDLEFLLIDKKKKIKIPSKIKPIKSKQERLSIIKTRQGTTKKFKHVKIIKPNFWLINETDNLKAINLLTTNLRLKHGVEKYNKYLKMYYFNNIKSHENIKTHLTDIYKQENNQFKIQISLGYVCENKTTGNISIFEPSQNYYFDHPPLVKSYKKIENMLNNDLRGDIITDSLDRDFPDTQTRFIGIYSMAVKITRLDFPIGSPSLILPNYIKNSMFIISLEKEQNNMCAWVCFALMHGGRRDRYTTKMKELFGKFYNLNKKEVEEKIKTYAGFDYINELDAFEKSSEFALNIINFNEDESIKYVRKSMQNDNKPPKYMNLFEDHFSYVTDLTKLAKSYACDKCNQHFQNNRDLSRHTEICNINQVDVFNKYSKIWQCKRNLIIELSDYFEVDVDFKYDYLVTYDCESIQLKIKENLTKKLSYVTQHVPISLSIATNIPGYEQEKFILSKDPKELTKQMFLYLDELSDKSEKLMKIKLKPLIDKINEYTNEKKRDKYIQQINDYCSILPVVGFNSSFYDTCLLLNEGFMSEILNRNSEPFILKAGNRYKQIKTNKLNFIDQISYCAPGTSLDSFIKAYDVGENKGIFPYEWFDSYNKLDFLVKDLKIEDFNSSLKNTKLEQSKFEEFHKTCESNNIIYIKDLLKHYNNLDVRPFLKACLKQKEFYYNHKLDTYKDAVSLPGLSENILFQFSIKGFDDFMKQPPPENNNIPKIFNSNIQKKIENYKEQDTKENRLIENYIQISEVKDLLEQFKYRCHYCHISILFGENLNSWSLDRIDNNLSHTLNNCVISCISCNRNRSDELYRKYYRKRAFLRYDKEFPLIRIVDNENREVFYKLKQNIVGGPSIVYHRYHEKDVTQITRVHYSENKSWYHESNGKFVKKISGFDANALYLYCLGVNMPCGELKWVETNEIHKYVNNKDFYGFLEVDIMVPKDKYEYFGEVCPIFKNVKFDEQVCGEYTKNMVLKLKNNFTESRKLIASLQANKILLLSESLSWLIDHGCVVTKLYGVIPAIPRNIFKGFADWVSDERRKGDRDIQYAIIAEAAKTVGNSAFGRTIMDKNKHTVVKFSNETKFNKLKNKSTYYDSVQYDNLYEVRMKKKKILQNMPLQIGSTVLNIAKMRMLSFAYDFVGKYIDRSDYQYMEMDTDSAYMALSGDFEDLIKPTLKEEYEKDKDNWFPRKENLAYDKRTPGLFKIEYEGDGMVALCSKSYYAWSDKKDKYTCKGVQKSQIKLNKDKYLETLYGLSYLLVKNKGFRFNNKSIKTYEQNKIGLSPIYTKGRLFEDGIHIYPLEI